MRHSGETRVQERVGVLAANHGSAGVGSTIPPIAQEFLAAQPFVVIAGEQHGDIWTTVLTGEPGFVRAPDDHTVFVDAHLPAVDPLEPAFRAPADIGMIAIDPGSRRRMRINGLARRQASGLVVHTTQVYANCPKYIQTRTVTSSQGSRGVPTVQRSTSLTPAQRAWITRADTFFIGTGAPGLGLDASHRGGNPGFVSISGDVITWPDYVGNSMYMTLGNLELDDRAGLLFIDWERGHTLHLSGRAVVDWSPARAAASAGAQRMVDFTVKEVVQVDDRVPLRWQLLKMSRFNPPVGGE